MLATRADFVANPERRWYETHRTRDKDQLRAPKVVALYRTDRGRFALDETGEWQPSIKTTICTAKEQGRSVAYPCGLLNSELLDLWYAVRGKRPRDVWRNYEPKRWPASRTGTPTPALGAAEAAAGVPAEMGASLTTDPSLDGEVATALEDIVRAVADNRRTLLPHRSRVRDLGRIVKDPWRTGPVEVSARALVEAMEPSEVASVRLDPALHLAPVADGPLGRASLQAGALVFKRGRQQTARLEGPSERIELLLDMLPGDPKLLPSEVESLLLPRDLGSFAERLRQERDSIEALLNTGRTLVEAAERLVCRLYGASPELEEGVVGHATARAAVSQAPAE